VQFEDSFKIWINREDTISLTKAITLARKNECDLVYDPLGIDGPDSWWWCVAVLEVLQQEDFIREFEVVEEAPSEQVLEVDDNVIY
jgi:hypothetical protein